MVMGHLLSKRRGAYLTMVAPCQNILDCVQSKPRFLAVNHCICVCGLASWIAAFCHTGSTTMAWYRSAQAGCICAQIPRQLQHEEGHSWGETSTYSISGTVFVPVYFGVDFPTKPGFRAKLSWGWSTVLSAHAANKANRAQYRFPTSALPPSREGRLYIADEDIILSFKSRARYNVHCYVKKGYHTKSRSPTKPGPLLYLELGTIWAVPFAALELGHILPLSSDCDSLVSTRDEDGWRQKIVGWRRQALYSRGSCTGYPFLRLSEHALPFSFRAREIAAWHFISLYPWRTVMQFLSPTHIESSFISKLLFTTCRN